MKLLAISLCVYVILWGFLSTGSSEAIEDFYEEFDDFEIDLTGANLSPKKQSNPMKISVKFENTYTDDTIGLYWISDRGEEILIADIPPLSSSNVDTTVSHTFTGRLKKDGTKAEPSLFVMSADKRSYTFGSATTTTKSQPAPKPFVQILNRRSTSSSAKFRSLVPSPIDIWYEDGRGGSYQGSLELGREYTVNSYIGHIFFFTLKGDKSKVFARHTVSAEQVLYIIEDPENPAPQHLLDHVHKELSFMEAYKNRTGLQWRHYFGPQGPRPAPVLHMWPAEEIGQIHRVISDAGKWHCLNYSPEANCQSSELVELELEVFSLRPRAFIIRNFLTEAETDAIIAYAGPRMAGSFVGNKDAGGARKSETRTSRNTWLGRDSFPITETLYRRAEHVLNISRLDSHNTEDIQVVHYIHGQRYDSHHDWGVSGYPESRFITLLLYLTDMASIDAGGETAFPKGADGKGIKVHPGKGNAVLFYDLLPDGNGDDLSLHAALPVMKGEKWLANFWVWDPHRK